MAVKKSGGAKALPAPPSPRSLVGQRTEIAINVRTDDGLTNGASNVIRLIQLNNQSKPSGLIWVQFDYEDVGKKT